MARPRIVIAGAGGGVGASVQPQRERLQAAADLVREAAAGLLSSSPGSA